MFAVIFEVQPKPERWDEYLELARSLRPELERIDGFIDNERFGSRTRQGWILSLSVWRDEKAVIRWRTLAPHHFAQATGRAEIFEDYHLRVGEIVADNNLPEDSEPVRQRLDETEVGSAKAVTVSEREPSERTGAPGSAADLPFPAPGTPGILDYEAFDGITVPGKQLLLAAWQDVTTARKWQPQAVANGGFRHRAVQIIRDYGLEDRREAPQYYPTVKRGDDRR